MPQSNLNLKALSMEALHSISGVVALDGQFLSYLQEVHPSLHDQLVEYRLIADDSSKASSYFLMDIAKHVEDFLAHVFDIHTPLAGLNRISEQEALVAAFKKHFVLREAKREIKRKDSIDSFEILNQWLEDQLPDYADRELAIARWAMSLLEDKVANENAITRLTDWCIASMFTEVGQQAVRHYVAFKIPKKLNFDNLVGEQPVQGDPWGRQQADPNTFRQRDGFELTDQRMTSRDVYNQIQYCVYCHKNDGDFCSTGFPVKKKDPSLGYKLSPAGDILTGCPLEERISEMHLLKRDGFSLAALAMVMRDNPMCAATGHRICNDCMKACIYQRQEPVNIPEIETRVLTDILDLPWGVEIYDLLTRWNPLRQRQYCAKPYNGKKVAVMGMGPAGFSLSHHLLMEGCAVVGFDGLKIEPIDREQCLRPIKNFSSITESLADRVMAGFGGVAEYGITVRWDKNFLKLILISLIRREYFQVFGCVRFGGTLTVDDVWQLGFDHLALAVGAGLPKELIIPNSLAPGMRSANDFLMSLQLTGAAKQHSLAQLQVRLPAVVIGGGLTGVDTATEVQAYYFVQLEKVARRYQECINDQGEVAFRKHFTAEDLVILDESLQHFEQWQTAETIAREKGITCDRVTLLREWGGVTIVYRRTMQESPAYQRNHEELTKALEEGLFYAEGLEPTAVILDDVGHCESLRCTWRVMNESGDWMSTDEQQLLPARSIFVATGAKPNVAYEFEHRGTFARERFEYQRFNDIDRQLVAATETPHVKAVDFGPFTSYQEHDRRVSFLGDTHSVFHGSVVKAIASAQKIYPHILSHLEIKDDVLDEDDYQDFSDHMQYQFSATVVSSTVIADDLIELTILAPRAARCFTPGQFYRLQNFETLAPMQGDTLLQMEALALMAIPVEEQPDQLRFLIERKSVNAVLACLLQPNDPIALMGPSGVKHQLPKTPSTVAVIGGLMGLCYVLSSAKAYQQAGHAVVYVGKLPQAWQAVASTYLSSLISDWSLTEGGTLEAIDAYESQAKRRTVSLSLAKQVFVFGDGDDLRSINIYRHQKHSVFHAEAQWVASVYGPMQCMLKGVCAQCLQWQIDPETGQRSKAVYACSWHHQPMDIIDLEHLDERSVQHRMQHTLMTQWLKYRTL
ncbi:MAG: pyridine nucleotide-disulfide oxidoreductase [Coxiellaceae bacterium]|nr:pyridine nucleotide-disulfide oxidoreductase [Coxiellaceae bacterium]|tara:strand:- start:8592 stop:12008 length:3417 start_codon:yes stop_codon:yes gene_type:complete